MLEEEASSKGSIKKELIDGTKPAKEFKSFDADLKKGCQDLEDTALHPITERREITVVSKASK